MLAWNRSCMWRRRLVVRILVSASTALPSAVAECNVKEQQCATDSSVFTAAALR